MKCRFEIVGLSGIDGVPKELKINGKSKYVRLLIKKVKEEDIKEPKDVALLMEYNKKFLIIGNMNAITYKEIFPLIKENQLWLGVSKRSLDFILQNGELTNVNAVWYTNLVHKKRMTPLDLYKHYNADEFRHYDNYDAIEVSKVCEIPMDYEGVMGVPITFLDKYCPSQFEIIGEANHGKDSEWDLFTPSVDGKTIFKRILIKRVSK